MFEAKGYKLICTYQDSFFVKEKYYDLFDVKGNLVELYLDGILALPRIPWIQDTLLKAGLNNKILDIIMNNVTQRCFATDTKERKMSWVDSQYENIKSTVEKIRLAAQNR